MTSIQGGNLRNRMKEEQDPGGYADYAKHKTTKSDRVRLNDVI